MGIKVYDWEGNERDLAYLKNKYGNFIIQPAATGQGPAYQISVLREKINTAASLVVKVTDENGAPLPNVRVAWYWPDAPEDHNAGPLGSVPPQMRPNRCVVGTTGGSGDVGFGMGHGAYYWPDQGQIGPHAAWIYGAETRSDLILGLGMVAATNHDHYDIEYICVEDGGGNGGNGGGGECPKDEILAEVAKIEAAIGTIRQLLADV